MTTVIPADNAAAQSAQALRRAGPAALEAALTRSREQLLALFDGWLQALGSDGLHVGFDPVLNLPLWELGHIGWFEEVWLARNRGRGLGTRCDPQAARSASLLAQADACYDSSNVAHAQRWRLQLPDPDATRRYLAAVRDATLLLLRGSAPADDALYFFRLALFHEAMHCEAWHVMAQHLGVDLGPGMTARAARAAAAAGEWRVPAGVRSLGTAGPGFAFDNELGAHSVDVDGYTIDRAPLSWERFLPFVESGGYAVQSAWTGAGWVWRQRHALGHPRHLRRSADGWQQCRFGVWLALDPAAPAQHISAHEAQAWCRWAGRRLPTEAEWETAALLAPALQQEFAWGEVWEWSASSFAPYPGFTAHPYRDYSQPWFDGRPALRGASFATPAHLKHPRFRNFFPADRTDIFSGMRSCALA